MIVKDEATLQQAMELTKQGRVWYHDQRVTNTNIDPVELEARLRHQLENDDIGVVALAGPEYFMEDYDYALKMVKKERHIEEQKAIRHWVTEHPEQVRKIRERAGKVARAKDLQIA